MTDVEYVLRIVLQARDELAKGLAKARGELAAFKRDADGLDGVMNKLNGSFATFDGHLDNITKKLDAWRATLRSSNDDGKALSKTLSAVGKSADSSSRSLAATARTQEQLQKSARKLRDEMREIHKAHEQGIISTKTASSEYAKFGRELDKLSLKMTEASRKKTPAHLYADEAEAAANRLKVIGNQNVEDARRRAAQEKSILADITAAVNDHVKQREQAERNTTKIVEDEVANRVRIAVQGSVDALEAQKRADKEAVEDHKATQKQLEKNIEDYNKRVDALTKEWGDDYNRIVKETEKNNTDITAEEVANRVRLAVQGAVDALEAQKQADKERVEQHKLTQKELEKNVEAYNKRVDDLTKEWGDEYNQIVRQTEKTNTDILRAESEDRQRIDKARTDAAIEELLRRQALQKEITDREAEAARLAQRAGTIGGRRDKPLAGDIEELREIAKGYDKLASSVKDNDDEFRRFALHATRVRAVVKEMGKEAEQTGNRFTTFFRTVGQASDNVAQLDNKLRGIILLAVASFAEQLITAVAGLAGELVSLASSAVAAGGALGGILAAGAAQALPVVGLLAGAISQVNAVMDAFQQNQKLQQAQFTDTEKRGQKTIDYTNRIANATDTATAANERLAESRKNLTQAQKDGEDQLQDLILAEKEAALAAKGANLNVKEAQLALKEAVAGGASALDIQGKQQALDEARLGRTRAGIGARRATRDVRAAGGDIGNLDSVKSAAKAVKDAERSVQQANRGLDQAQDKSDRAAASTMTAAANLNFLLSQMGPAERKLYQAVNRIYTNYRKVFIGTGKKDGIYGVIIDSFTRAVNEADKLMRMPRVIRRVQGLANEIAKQFNKIIDALTSQGELDQFLQIIDDATTNLGPLTDMAIKLGDAFTNIATTANPAFQSLLEYLGPVVDKFLAMTEDKDKMEDFFNTGEQHLEAWLDLVLAIIGLFAALFGASADTGKKSVEDLTDQIKGWTNWINDHREETQKFFTDAYKVVKILGGVLEELAVQLAKTFSPEHLEKFAKFFEDVLLPALGAAIRTMGDVTDLILTIVNSDIGSQVAKWGLFVLVFAQIASSSLGAIKYVTTLFGHLKEAAGAFTKIGNNAKKAKDDMKDFSKWDEERKKKERIPDRDARAGGGDKPGFFGRIRGAAGKIGGGAAAGAGGVAGAEVAGGAAAGGAAVGLGIAAGIAVAIAAVIALLAYFGKLDDVWDGMKKAFLDFIDDVKPAWEAMLEAFADIGIKIDGVDDIVDSLKKTLEGLADFIATYIIENLKGLGDVLAGVFIALFHVIGGVIRVLHGVADIIIGIFTLDFDQIMAGFENLVTGIIEILGGIVQGVIKIFEGLIELLLAPFKAAWKAIKKWFGIDSPSKKAMELGKAILDGIVDGLKGLISAITWPFRKAWNAILGIFGLPKIEQIGKDVIEALGKGFRAGVEFAKKGASWVWGRIKEIFGKALDFGKNIAGAIVDGLKTLPDLLMDGVKAIGNKFIDVGKAIGKKIWEGAKSVIGWLNPFDGGGDDKKDDKKGGGPSTTAPATTVTKTGVGDMMPGTIPFGADDLKGADQEWQDFWAAIRAVARNSTDYIQRQFREMRIATSNSAEKMYEQIRGSLADIQHSFDVRGDKIVSSWTATWRSMEKVTYDGLTYIGHETNKVLKNLGEKSISFGLVAPKEEPVDRKQRGGIIGGFGDGDKVHVLAEPGEGFINKRAVRALGGPAFINFINTMIPRFASGGIVPIPGQPGESIHSSILGDVRQLIRQYKLTITDGYGGSPPHAPNSDHKWGGAIDAVPDFARGGSWALVSKLARIAEPSQGHPVSPWRWVGYNGDPGHGEGNHLHLSWMRGKNIHGLADVATSILRRLVSGPAGAMKTIAQAALDGARKVANSMLGHLTTDPLIEGDEGPGAKYGKGALTQGQVENTIRRALSILKIASSIALWVRGATRQAYNESTFNPDAQNTTADGVAAGRPKGLMQVVDGTFAAYSLPGHKNVFNPLDNMIAAIRYVVSRYGGGDPDRGAAILWARGGGAYAEGGVVPGNGSGDTVPAWLTPGEHVWTKGEVEAAGGHGAMFALRRLLGGGGQGGPFGYQAGGHVVAAAAVSGRSGTPRIDRGIQEINKLIDEINKAFETVHKQAAAAATQVKAKAKPAKIQGTLGKAISSLDDVINGIIGDNGLANQIAKNFDRAGRMLKMASFRIGEGGKVFQNLSQQRVLERQLDDLVVQGTSLLGEKSDIQAGLRDINRLLKAKGTTSRQRQALRAQRKQLLDALDNANQAIADNMEARLQAQIAVQQQIVDDIRSGAERKGRFLDIAKRIKTAMGQSVDSINDSIAANLADQRNQLAGRIEAARSAGATDLAKQLEEDVADLDAQIAELASQRFQDSIDAINKAATRRLGHLDLFQRMADAVGTIGGAVGIPALEGVMGPMTRGGILAQRGGVLAGQRAGIAGMLGQAAAAGNTEQIEALTDQLAELDVQIAENTKAQRDFRETEAAAAFDYSSTINDLDMRLLDAKDAISGNTSTQEKLALLQERATLLAERGNELQGFLNDARARGDDKAVQDLTKQLKENELATLENTKAVNTASGEGSTPKTASLAWSWFRSPIFTGTGEIMPNYAMPGNMAMPGINATASTTSSGGNTFITNIEVNEAGQPIDPTKLASNVVFAQATAQ